ncbi:MAG: type II toxin-antitoxin system VapC family toxin [Thaumarchaeota archaeon]|nr:type II toxin-antitoxin system VapC family toxin [Nitrososphaerota archaeon]
MYNCSDGGRTLQGAYASRERASALREVKGLLDRFVILDLDYDSGRIWGQLARSMRSDSIGDRDMFIASISLSNNQTLVTRNMKHFERVEGLRVEGW